MSSDYQLEDTVYLPFTTRAFATGIPTALVSGEVQIYEDAFDTQITAAETLLASHDTIPGFNLVSVVATNANGFGVGQSYTAVLSAGTVDSVSVVGEVIGHFTLDMSAAAKDLAQATDGLGALRAALAVLELGIITGVVQTGTLSVTQCTTDLTGYLNDQLIRGVIVFTSGAADGERSPILDYEQTNGRITYAAIQQAPANGDTFKIV